LTADRPRSDLESEGVTDHVDVLPEPRGGILDFVLFLISRVEPLGSA
jgi:hypothetical protein